MPESNDKQPTSSVPLDKIVMQFKHDCNDCVPLGQHEGYDLYYCPNEPTVIARFSDDGPDYNSGMEFAKSGLIPQLVEARNRAIKLGLCEA